MHVLVTGGAGFIGSNVARLLCDAGHAVTVLDNLSYGHRFLVDPRCRFVEADLADGAATAAAMEGVEAVMHFAASSIIARSFSDPMEYVENNIVNGTRLLEAMRLRGVRQIVFSSSASVYGEPERIPVREDDPKRPLQMYGASKLAFENVLQGYYHAFGIQSVALRYFNAYGPGDLQEPATRAVPRWIRAALCDQPIVLNWGGQQYRDYVFVEDIARAHIRVLGLEGLHAFNVGTGSGVLMREVVDTLQAVLDRPLRVDDGGPRLGDPMRLVAATTRLHEATGWQPTVDLREGLRRAVAFYEAQRPLWQAAQPHEGGSGRGTK